MLQEKQAAVIQAKGESEAAQLISDALAKNGDGITPSRIETARHALIRYETSIGIVYGNCIESMICQLSRSRNVTYLPGGSNMLLNVAP